MINPKLSLPDSINRSSISAGGVGGKNRRSQSTMNQMNQKSYLTQMVSPAAIVDKKDAVL